MGRVPGSVTGAGSAGVPRAAEPVGPDPAVPHPKACGLRVATQDFRENRTCCSSWKREDGCRDVGREGWRRWKGRDDCSRLAFLRASGYPAHQPQQQPQQQPQSPAARPSARGDG